LTILEGLAHALGVEGRGAILTAGAIDRREAARVFQAIAAARPERIQDEAAKLWGRLFGEALPALRKVAPEGLP
jgi:hypothetical protein